MTGREDDEALLDACEATLWTLGDDERRAALDSLRGRLTRPGVVVAVIARNRFPAAQYRMLFDMLERRFGHFGVVRFLFADAAVRLTAEAPAGRGGRLADWTGQDGVRAAIFVDCPQPETDHPALTARFAAASRFYVLSVDHQGTALRRLVADGGGGRRAEIDTAAQPQLLEHHLARALAATGGVTARYAYGMLQIVSNEIGPVDSLGYRIGGRFEKLADRPPTEKVVAVTGGSAAFGFRCFHDHVFTQALERRLNAAAAAQGRAETFRVLNFAVSGHALLDEMRSFMLFAWAAKPDLVISHSGFNDFFYGPNIDPALMERFSLIYCHVHDQVCRTAQEPPDLAGLDLMIDAYVNRLRQFAVTVSAFGAGFLFGLQPITAGKNLTGDEAAGVADWLSHFSGSSRWGDYRLMLESVHAAYPRLRRRLFGRGADPGFPCLDGHAATLTAAGRSEGGRSEGGRSEGGPRSLFFDPVHMTPDGHAALADVYFQPVWERLTT